MSTYEEDDFLQLSGIQHFAFCKRQWALAYIELQWQENIRTVEGKLLHEKTHDPFSDEKRGDLIISRGMPVRSRTLGISGECDVVEFRKSSSGIPLYGREGLYQIVPVEYKRGEPKENDVDILQLTAQAMCLEEMFCTSIDAGFLFYGETRRRFPVRFEETYRNRVTELFTEMHQLFDRRYSPKVKRTKSCNACSLNEVCLPVLLKNRSAKEYISERLDGGGNQ